MLALGAALALRGPLAAAGVALAAAGAVVASVAALAAARHDGGQDLARLPIIAAEALAWSAGLTLAVGAGLRAFHGDREQGVLALVRARGATARDYVEGRVGGLSLVVGSAVGGGALVAALVCTAVGGGWPAARAGAAAAAYAAAFGVTMAPVAMAALGARTRARGYLIVVAVVAVPELVSPWTSTLLPRSCRELTSIPAALDALPSAIASPSAGVSALRALAGLGAVVVLSLAVVRARVARAEPWA